MTPEQKALMAVVGYMTDHINYVETIKLVRTETGMALKEAKDWVDDTIMSLTKLIANKMEMRYEIRQALEANPTFNAMYQRR